MVHVVLSARAGCDVLPGSERHGERAVPPRGMPGVHGASTLERRLLESPGRGWLLGGGCVETACSAMRLLAPQRDCEGRTETATAAPKLHSPPPDCGSCAQLPTSRTVTAVSMRPPQARRGLLFYLRCNRFHLATQPQPVAQKRANGHCSRFAKHADSFGSVDRCPAARRCNGPARLIRRQPRNRPQLTPCDGIVSASGVAQRRASRRIP